MRYIHTNILCFVLFFSSLFSNAQSLTIACAANFRDPMTMIVNEFKAQNPSIEIKTIFGSSGNLYHQITNRAPYDIYFAANKNYPQRVYEAGLSYDEPKIYAIGQLVLWSKMLDVSNGLEVLKSKNISRIAIANPELAPYGKSAVECLNYFELSDILNSKIVTAENIAQTAQFAVTGNADVAFIAKSQLIMKAMKGKGSNFEIPIESYSPIEQAFVVIKRKENETITQKFVAFLSNPEIEQMIQNYGYKLRVDE